MHIAWVIVLLIVGFVLIIKGGDVFVDAASWFAESFGIPKLLVGATVVSIATTLPEMLVSTIAAIGGKVDMALGNAIGSVTVNIGVAFAVALIFMPMTVNLKTFAPKALLMVGTALTLFVFALLGVLPWYGCVILLLFCIAFFFFNIREAKKEMAVYQTEVREKPTRKKIIINIIKFVLGALAIALGAQLLVDNGSELARICGMSEAMIGATIMAVGTSLPEIATAITSVIKKQGSLSVGNIIGANIIDMAIILPLCTLIGGGTLAITGQAALLDIPVCLGIIAVAVVPTLFTKKLQRWQGVLLFAGYLAYFVVMCLGII